MKHLIASAHQAYYGADWVSHVKLVSQVIGEMSLENPLNLNNICYTVEHIEVFKKPETMKELSSEIFGSSLGHLNLEVGKEYLLCGEIDDGLLSCSPYGQVKPDEISRLVAEWDQIPELFKDEMRTYGSLFSFINSLFEDV